MAPTRESPEGRRWTRASDLSHGAATTEPLETSTSRVRPPFPSPRPAPDTPTTRLAFLSISLYSFSVSRSRSLFLVGFSPFDHLSTSTETRRRALCSFSFARTFLRRVSLLRYACIPVYLYIFRYFLHRLFRHRPCVTMRDVRDNSVSLRFFLLRVIFIYPLSVIYGKWPKRIPAIHL